MPAMTSKSLIPVSHLPEFLSCLWNSQLKLSMRMSHRVLQLHMTLCFPAHPCLPQATHPLHSFPACCLGFKPRNYPGSLPFSPSSASWMVLIHPPSSFSTGMMVLVQGTIPFHWFVSTLWFHFASSSALSSQCYLNTILWFQPWSWLFLYLSSPFHVTFVLFHTESSHTDLLSILQVCWPPFHFGALGLALHLVEIFILGFLENWLLWML